MNIVSIDNLHNDHSRWSVRIADWKAELENLEEKLNSSGAELLNEADSRFINKRINTIRHHKRFLNELLEVINTHDAFLEDVEVLLSDPEGIDLLMDHHKTRQHINSFEGKLLDLKNSFLEQTEP